MICVPQFAELHGPPHSCTVSALACDVAAGLLVTALLLHIGHPYFRLTHYTEAVVVSVRQLLAALKGFPIGLKLNIELNNFMLGIFTYHIDLWMTFLVLVAPVLHGLFVPFVAVGAVGLSTQLALLADLLVFVSLHAHCFYIYVAVLYHNQLAAIDALWRVLCGRRRNGLKGDRVESVDYSNPQLYLATMLFASLLFLLPTVLMYYVVFAFVGVPFHGLYSEIFDEHVLAFQQLRFCVYCITYVLIAAQRAVLTMPVHAFAVRLLNVARNRSGRVLRIDALVASGLPNCVTLTTVVAGADDEPLECADGSADIAGQMPMLSVFQFFMGLVRGQIMGFVLPQGKG